MSTKKAYTTAAPSPCCQKDAGGTLYTPVDNEKRQIREVISGEEAQALIDDMLNIEMIGVADEKRRELSYKEAIP